MSQQPQKLVINKRWQLDGILGQGGFGSVYLATDLRTNRFVAVKIQNIPPDPPPSQTGTLACESLYYILLRKHPGIAALHDNGRQGPYQFIVFELLGASLQSLFYRCGRKFSLKTTLMLADQLVQRLEVFHSNNLLHRDVKPDNFAMGFGEVKGKTVYIMDFGLVGDYTHDEKSASAPSDAFCGTYTWAAIAAHLDRSQSPKDDLESLAYMLIYFARGHLPWQGCAEEGDPPTLMRERITRLKLNLPIDLICNGLPSAFSRHLKYVRSLKYNDKPDYARLRAMYQRLMKRRGYEYDGVFDWDLIDGSIEQQEKEQEVNAKLLSVGNRLRARRIEKHKLPTENLNKREKRVKAVQQQRDEIQEAASEGSKETKRPRRRIILTRKASNETPPPIRQRSKPAHAARTKTKNEKVVAKKTAANKIVAKKAPQKKPRARITSS